MIDLNKQYKTRGGKEVVLFAKKTDRSRTYPIIGAIRHSGGWETCLWTKDGKFIEDEISHDDLIDDTSVVPYRTVGGHRVKIYEKYPDAYHGAIYDEVQDTWILANWTSDGSWYFRGACCSDKDLDLNTKRVPEGLELVWTSK